MLDELVAVVVRKGGLAVVAVLVVLAVLAVLAVQVVLVVAVVLAAAIAIAIDNIILSRIIVIATSWNMVKSQIRKRVRQAHQPHQHKQLTGLNFYK